MKKTSDYYAILYASIAMNVKTNDYFRILYVGIVTYVKNQWLLRDPYAGIAYMKWPYGIYNRK